MVLGVKMPGIGGGVRILSCSRELLWSLWILFIIFIQFFTISLEQIQKSLDLKNLIRDLDYLKDK